MWTAALALLVAGCKRDEAGGGTLREGAEQLVMGAGSGPDAHPMASAGEKPAQVSAAADPQAASTVACDAPPVRADRPRTGPLPSARTGALLERLEPRPFARGGAPITFEALAEEAEGYAASVHPLARIIAFDIRRLHGDGTVSVADGVAVTLGWNRLIPGARPGDDVDAGLVRVQAGGPGDERGVPSWRGTVLARGSRAAGSADRRFVDSELDHCTVAKAWKLAVGTGVPSDSVASVRFESRGRRPEYIITVDGHPESWRSVEIACCRVSDSSGRVLVPAR